MEGLGRLFNVVAVADDVFLNMRDAAGVTFIGINAAGDTWTLQEADAASGGTEQDLAVIDRSHVQAVGVGADAWVLLTQVAAATEVTSAAQDVVAIYVPATSLSDGFTHLKLTATGAGIVIAILHDLDVQRNPVNLPALAV
jgi:hypothetical protein